jgi:CRP/FNR family transcriptional regulator
LSRDEIAGLVGTATETTIRMLHSLQDEGLLEAHGRKLKLMNKELLRSL